MNILINLSNNLGGGGLQVALSFLEECKKIEGHVYHIFLGKNAQMQVDKNFFPADFVFYDIPKLKFWQYQIILGPLEKQIKPDCVFTVFGPSYWKPNAPHLIGFAIGHYIYDEYAFFNRISCWQRMKIKLRKWVHLLFFVKQASHFVVETEDARKRLRKQLNVDTIDVVSNTCGSQYFCHSDFANKMPEKKRGEIRLITLTRYYSHKNIESIPNVLEELKLRNIDNVNFVLTLGEEDYKNIIPMEWRHKVYNVGSVPIVECPSLYQECDFLFLPTLLEVFSASYPEAMAMRKPILTSDLSFAHSICGDAALYFEPFSPSDIVDKIEILINNKEAQVKLIEEGKKRLSAFGSAKDRAEKYLQICENLAFGVKYDIVHQ